MNDQDAVDEKDFYQEVADLLGCDHNYKKFPYTKRTRWNGRESGNGRYPGFGIVRRFSSTSIHVQLHTPMVTGHFTSATDALTAIQLAVWQA